MDWLSTPDSSSQEAKTALRHLAKILIEQHADPWLNEFLHARESHTANALLKSAIQHNISGNRPMAIHQAMAAARAFRRSGNFAGVLRSELEVIYGLRLQSKARECQKYFALLQPWLQKMSAPWVNTRILVEASGCLAMTNDFDRASAIAKQASEDAQAAHYAALNLRVLSYVASLHTVEGRLRQSWQTNEAGLAIFWQAVFTEDRGYQFYVDLEFAAEKALMWHAAAILQAEAVSQLERSPRLDFRAFAHCRLARANQRLGNFQAAQNELAFSEKLFEQMEQNDTTVFYKANCLAALATLEAETGATDAAMQHLAAVQSALQASDNFTVRLAYEKAWASIERQRSDREQEVRHLKEAIAIGDKGFGKLRDHRERWEWRRSMEEIYRRYLELQMEGLPDPAERLAAWESFRTVENPRSSLNAFTNATGGTQLIAPNLERLRESTLLVFAVFPHWTRAWVARNGKLKEFVIPVEADDLEREVLYFRALCADKDAPLEKVKSAGSRLYQLLKEPLEASLNAKGPVFMEADRALSFLPWPALVKADGTYLGESAVIVNTPGLFEDVNHKVRKRGRFKMLVAYPGAVDLDGVTYTPLPHAREEAEEIAAMFPEGTYLPGREVTSLRILQELPQASVFHFAGHAVTRENNGELIIHADKGGEAFSALRLRRTALQDGMLVVLSACSTGSEVEPDRDPNGLIRAFLDSGAGRVISSQWDVDSAATLTLMRSFYRSLVLDKIPEKALGESQKQLISSSITAHPYYWAGFQVFGPVN